MPRIPAVNPATATGKTKQLLDAVQAKLGLTPNLMKTLGHAPSALEAYLNFNGALASGVLDSQFREQIALAVAQANSCEYCLAAHTAIGAITGLSQQEIAAGRDAQSANPKRNAGLRFAKTVVVERGNVSDSALAQVRAAGYSDGEITEIIANVAINIFTNYFNQVAQTEVDFPRVSVALASR